MAGYLSIDYEVATSPLSTNKFQPENDVRRDQFCGRDRARYSDQLLAISHVLNM